MLTNDYNIFFSKYRYIFLSHEKVLDYYIMLKMYLNSVSKLKYDGFNIIGGCSLQRSPHYNKQFMPEGDVIRVSNSVK